jgi:pilus assembly protein Flp/PilA
VTSFLPDEQGQDLVEYALIVAAVGLAMVATMNKLAGGIANLYSDMTLHIVEIHG